MIPRILIVREKTAAVIERLGRFTHIAEAGFHIMWPLQRVAGRVSLKLQEMSVHVETKTLDDVFVRIVVAIQYYVRKDRVREAFYELSNPQMQIESFVYDEVRAQVPKMKLDDVFQNKEDIATAVKTGLDESMTQYGYDIVKTLVNDIDPAANVKAAMNEINAAQRIRRASEERGEAEKILRIKQAEAEAASMRLRGVGIADQRKAIIDGLRQSVEEFSKSVPGATANDVMSLVVLTQYFDTLKEIGGSSRTNTVMIPHSPSAVGDMQDQIRQSIMIGNVASATATEASEHAPPIPDIPAPEAEKKKAEEDAARAEEEARDKARRAAQAAAAKGQASEVSLPRPPSAKEAVRKIIDYGRSKPPAQG